MTGNQPENTPEDAKKALTNVYCAYTLPCTPNENESEVDKLQVKHFLNTLAEVALAVASRRVGR
ncbi:MAG: hypothetical protein HYX90_08915 [Chloroflexi bacterium]|nr:hypothetical protein [Chloroflexota bacterium]